MKLFNSIFIYAGLAVAVLSGIFLIAPSPALADHVGKPNITTSASLTPGLHELGNIDLGSGEILTIQGNCSANTGVTIIADNVTIASGGSISANGQGCSGGVSGNAEGKTPSGQTGGGSSGNSSRGGGGGGYGGSGGSGQNSIGVGPGSGSGGSAYGAAQTTQPAYLGSGGGFGSNTGTGGAGGGAIKLVVLDSLLVNGIISANGNSGNSGGGGNAGGGGGSGGSIWIITGALDGTGSISANGGTGGGGPTKGGGGGGGRIAVYYFGTTTFSQANITVLAGGASGGAGPGTAGPSPTFVSYGNTAGFAWSENIGWISFSCYNDLNPATPATDHSCDQVIYGTNINKTTGVFTGYAWSENIGWIQIDPTGPYPEAPLIPSTINLTNGQMSGWARALATSGGWDGWIKMRGTLPDYGVLYDSVLGELKGWAWGSDVVGWVSFNCVNEGTCGVVQYAVTVDVNTIPVVWNLTQTPNYVTSQNFEISPPFHQFSWEFSDLEDGSNLTSYRLQIDDNSSFTVSDPCDANITYNLPPIGLPTLASPISRQVQVVVDAIAGPLNICYNKTYFWRVQGIDSAGKTSGWTYPPSPFQASPDKSGPGSTFNTALHIYPTANFNFFPSQPSEGEEITFVENATCYDISGNVSGVPLADCTVPAGNYKWDFDYIGGVFSVDATGATVTRTYDTVGTDCAGNPGHCVAFEITDQDGLTTRISKNISIKKPLPQFRERAPSGMIDKVRGVFAGIWRSLAARDKHAYLIP